MKRFLSKRNILILTAAFLYFAAWNRGINLLYVIASMLTGLLFVSFALSRFSVMGLDIRRNAPTVANEEDMVFFDYWLTSCNRLPRFVIELEDVLGWGGPPLTLLFEKINGKGSVRQIRGTPALLRGRYIFSPLTLRSSTPLGLFSSERRIAASQSLLVYPKVFQIDYIPLTGSGSLPLIGIETMSAAGASNDFFGVRDYQHGDSIRYIHWPSTARHGRLIVKEFELNASTEVTVVLDSGKGVNSGIGKESTFEYAVKAAASISNYAIMRGNALAFMSQGIHLPFGKGTAHLAAVLEALACIRPEGASPFNDVMKETARSVRDGATVCLVFPKELPELEALQTALTLLKAKHNWIIAVFIEEEGFIGPGALHKRSGLRSSLIAGGARVYNFRKGDHLSEVFNR